MTKEELLSGEGVRDDDEFWKDGAVAYQIIARKATNCHLTLMEIAEYIDSLSDWEIMEACEELRGED